MDNSAVIPFQFQSTTVRTVIKDGEPWFVAKDICDVLELSDTNAALRGLDEDEKGTTISRTPGGSQTMLTVNESGLYALVFKSRKPEAKTFRKWVTSEVLPTLRRTGKYDTSQAASAYRYNSLEPDRDAGILAYQFEGMCRLAKMFGLEGNQALLKADKAVRKLHGGASPIALLEIELKTPNNEALIIPSEMGRLLNPPISAKSLNRALAAMGLQEKREYKPKAFEWRLTDKGKAFGAYFDVGRKHSDGTPVLQIKWRESVAGLVAEHLNN